MQLVFPYPFSLVVTLEISIASTQIDRRLGLFEKLRETKGIFVPFFKFMANNWLLLASSKLTFGELEMSINPI
jgi:hypothetical protein